MSANFVTLFDLFVRHRRYVDNYSENTIKTYHLGWKTYQRVLGTSEISKALSVEFVAKMRESGITPASCNVHIKAMNGFLLWLYENEYILELVHIKHVKAPDKVVKPIPEDSLKKLIAWKPKKQSEHRLHTLVCVLIDTGLRIDEALSLTRAAVDFDNLIVRVRGKGNKERLVPFSFECRKVLFKFLQRHDYDWVFSTHNGTRYSYRNCWRDLQNVFDKLGLDHAGLHAFRHAFAKGYLKSGGNLLYLSRQLGHKKLATTQRYVQVETGA